MHVETLDINIRDSLQQTSRATYVRIIMGWCTKWGRVNRDT